MEKLNKYIKNAKIAAPQLALYSTKDRNAALESIANMLINNIEDILKYNQIDIDNAKANNMAISMLDRLTLTKERIIKIVKDIHDIIALDDPIGEIIEKSIRPNGLIINKVRVPLGVLGVIYEARPNVTIDIAVLAIKTGNVCVLKGGSDAFHTNLFLTNLIRKVIKNYIPEDSVVFIDETDRSVTDYLIKSREYIDVIIPRGGKGLISYVLNNASVPVIETGAGNCHLYIHEKANVEMAINILINGKVSRPSVCNAIETLLIDEKTASKVLPLIKDEMNKYNVEIRGCLKTSQYITVIEATEADFFEEYNNYIIVIKVVDNVNEAIKHIEKYGTHHSDCIITEDLEIAEQFLNNIDSACVYWNASTRFSDGGEFGFGAELGISTQKLHARGPMGLKEMTSYKYKIYGKGQIR